jgi:hypothetical protein
MEQETKKKDHHRQAYVKDLGYNAALAKRMAEPFANGNRVMFMDARFGSFKAGVELRKMGVHPIFDIKTAHALFPKAALIDRTPIHHGGLCVMETTMILNGEPETFYAVGQRRGPKVHTFLCTSGTFDLEIPRRFNKITDPDEVRC